ncbi:ABC-type transport system substrate-binding protein [Mycoplana sp. BE70]|nr:ABC transporter substrate-binding protein [Mycoplana sp. BE70]MDR6758171.1 ABC-type transport system substrate-binding protein [Mycoplana sp. BE70]
MGTSTKLSLIAATLSLSVAVLANQPVLASELIRIVSPYQTTALDPMRSAAAGNIETYGQLYARLLQRNPTTGELEPGLAESWDVSENGETYTFHLRDAQFSNGTPITADDVVFSLSRNRATSSQPTRPRWVQWKPSRPKIRRPWRSN